MRTHLVASCSNNQQRVCLLCFYQRASYVIFIIFPEWGEVRTLAGEGKTDPPVVSTANLIHRSAPVVIRGPIYLELATHPSGPISQAPVYPQQVSPAFEKELSKHFPSSSAGQFRPPSETYTEH